MAERKAPAGAPIIIPMPGMVQAPEAPVVAPPPPIIIPARVQDYIPDDKLNLSTIAKHVNDKVKMEALVPGTEDNLATIRTWVPTTITLVNLFLYGGIPIGRIWEVFGENHEGKTAFLILLMIAVQRYGGITVYLDAEGTWDEHRARRMGHNPARHIYCQADTVEAGDKVIGEVIHEIREVQKLTCPVLIGWDTIAASQMEAEKKMKDAQTAEEKKKARYKEGMASKPRVVREMLRRYSLELSRQQVGMVFVNHTIADFDQFGPGYDTPGGGAIKFWTTYRVQVYRSGQFKPDNQTDCGICSTLKMIKCKVGRPLRRVEIPLTYDHGWDEDYANFDYLTRKGHGQPAEKLIAQSGAWYYINVPKDWQDQVGTKEIKLYRSQLKEKIERYPALPGLLAETVATEWQSESAVP